MLLAEAHKAEVRHDYGIAVERAERTWQHLDGALRYLKADGRNMPKVFGIEIVLQYAPLLFDAGALVRLEDFCIEKRRILKSFGYNFDPDVICSRQLMKRAQMLWSELERRNQWPSENLRQTFSGDDEEWEQLVGIWTSMNAVVHKSIQGVLHLSLATQMDALTSGKCPRCGTTTTLTKAQMLDRSTCPGCAAIEVFVEII